MNTFEKVNSANDSDLSEKDYLCNVTNTHAAVFFAEYSNYSKTNMSLSCTSQTTLLSSYCHTNTFKKGNSANYSDMSEQDNLRNFKNKNAAVCFSKHLDSSE